MGTLWQDIKYGVRVLARNPGFSLIVVALVAVGVGASTTVFSILNPLLIRPLAYEEPDRIVCVQPRNKEGDDRNVSYPDYLDWRREAMSFDELSCYAFRDRPVSFAAHEPPEECCVGFVSDNFFRIFPVRPVVGRFFSPADDRPSAAPVAVISHTLWRRHLGADPDVIGRFIFVDDLGYNIIGVLPPAFRFFPYAVEESADVWVAMARTMAESSRGDRSRAVLGRLKAGRSIQEAQAEMDTLCARLAAEYPASNAGMSATITRLHDFMRRLIGQALGQGTSVLMGTVLLVFLVACANAAGLMFARGVTREREMALRSALGGTRLRLMRLVLAENVVLAVLGGGLGVLGAAWIIQLLMETGLLPSERFPVGFFHPDWRVLGFALVLSFLTVPLCGLIPSICCSGVGLARMLAAGGRSVLGSRGRNAAHTGLLAAQVALTIVLLTAAGLMIRSLLNVVTADRGFNSENVLVMNLRLVGDRYAGDESKFAFHRQLLDQLGATPGVERAGLTWPLLTGWSWYFYAEGEPVSLPDEEGALATYKAVSPGYFETMGIRLLRGRFFDERDYRGSQPVVIVDETLAKRCWPGGNAIGRRIQYARNPDPNLPWYEIVGVVAHVRNEVEADARMQVYKALFQGDSARVSIVLRTRSDPTDLVAAVKNAVGRIDRRQLVWGARTLKDEFWYRSLVRRFVTSLLIAFAGIGLLLSAAGIYAITRYSVSRRTQELGIRMALGANANDVLGLVLRKGLMPVLMGTGIGLVGAVATARVLSSLLFDVGPWDPATYATVSLLLSGIALFACYLPARQAARIDPMTALRYD